MISGKVIVAWVGIDERKVGKVLATCSRRARAVVLLLGGELLPLVVDAGRVVEISVEASVFGIVGESMWAREEVGGHVVNI